MKTIAKFRMLPYLVGIVTAIASIILWQGLDARETTQIKRVIQLEASGIRKIIQAQMGFRVNALVRMAERWKAIGKTPKEEWEFDARSYVDHSKGFQAIEWVDPSFHVRRVVPLKGNERAINLNLGFEERRRAALKKARDKRTPTLTRAIDLVQGGKGFLVYVPIFRDEKFGGFILGVFRAQALFQTFLSETEKKGYSVTIYDGDTEIYSHKQPDQKLEEEWAREVELKLHGITWRLRAWPTKKLLSDMQSSLPILVLFSGITGALLLTMLIVFMQSAKVRAEQIAAVTHELKIHTFKQNQAEIVIRTSEAQLASVLETAADAILTIDSKGIVLTMNRTAEQQFGWEAKDVIGQNVSMLMPKPQSDEHNGYLSRYIETREARIIGSTRELRGLRRDGSEFPMELSVSEVDVDGTLTFTGIVRDISERKAAEIRIEEEIQNTKALARRMEIAGEIAKSASSISEPEELFRTIVAEIRSAIPCERCVIAGSDPKTERHRFLHVESTIEVQPYPDEDEEHKTVDWFVHDLYQKKQAVSIHDLLEGHHPWATQLIKAGFRSALLVPIQQGELSVAHLALHSTQVAAFSKDQEILLESIASHLGSVLRNANLFQEAKERASRLEMVSDIAISFSETLELEELFEKVVREIRRVVPCSRCVICSINRDTLEFDYWKMSSDFEVTPLTKEQDAESIELILREVYETKQPRNIPDLRENPIWRVNRNTQKELRSHLTVPIVQNNQTIGHFSIVSTEIGAFSDEQIHLLTSIAGHLGSAIQNSRLHKELKQRVDELARSNVELTQFAYVASHDLQEPLRMVTSYTELLARRHGEKLGADAHEFIQFAVDGARRMQGLINDLLAFSRLERKGKELKPTDCEGTLDRALENLMMSIEESGGAVTRDPLPMVMADPSQLSQLFQNLIGNAIKFRNEEPPRVHVSVKPNSKEWIFSVQDNGIGMEPEYRERIFQIFQRLHNREEFSGTGVGLAICRKIVERHGGRIWVESELHQGSTFYFTLPARGE